MILKRGTLCVIVGGCPANIGVIVEVLARLGRFGGRADAYHVRTVSGRPFAQFWEGGGAGGALIDNPGVNECITDRHKLRPLVDPKVKAEGRAAVRKPARKRELQSTR
jgi:hypothetical protein